MNPALIGVGAALGIAIPLVTAIGAAFSRTSREADAASESLDQFEQKTRDALDAIQAFNLGISVEVLEQQRRLNGLLIDRAEILTQIQELEQLGAITAPNEAQLAAIDEEIQRIRDAIDLREYASEREQSLENIREQAREAARNWWAERQRAAEEAAEKEQALVDKMREFEQATKDAANAVSLLNRNMTDVATDRDWETNS